ncbi:hypothetical protein SISSUDRAFT_447275 [Sistotremastrum suecicum HHB10207 ss-3]|uniref:Uncharacterized protein n=1 Tax=Sistotremastrum suecicum HHB10207 ss-3 TaxID=1314776 RepID=A0A166FGN3_9AGAM|nr:hypothetical protein SISSUDRAFT_447275 [Sistotremastrum suecicum HHB10207 ss-3]
MSGPLSSLRSSMPPHPASCQTTTTSDRPSRPRHEMRGIRPSVHPRATLPARRCSQDRSWMYLGCTIRMTTDTKVFTIVHPMSATVKNST